VESAAAVAGSAAAAAARQLVDEAAIDAEVALQLRACVPALTPFQAMLVQEQLDLEPSRLYARLCQYVRLVQEVEAYATASASAKSAAVQAQSEATGLQLDAEASETEASAAPHAAAASVAVSAAPSPVPPAVPGTDTPASAPTPVPGPIKAGSAAADILAVPQLSHSTFLDCLKDNLLRLLEERWDAVFVSGGPDGSSVSCNDGKRISKSERARKGLNKSALVYGEVDFHTLGEVLWGPHCIGAVPATGAVFVDLGSGTGRGVLAAAELMPFSRCIGVEILEGLHASALSVAAHYEKTVRSNYSAANGDPRAATRIELICGSFTDLDWAAAADVVFCNSTCFDDALMDEIALQGQGLREGALVISLTRSLESPYFKLLSSEQYKMSWGHATINIAMRVQPTPEDIARAHAEKQAQLKQRNRYTGLD